MQTNPQSVVTQVTPPDSEAPPQIPATCAYCGEPLTSSARFCPRCGQRQASPAAAVPPSPPPLPIQVLEPDEPVIGPNVPPAPVKQALTLKTPPAPTLAPIAAPAPPPAFRLLRILPDQDPLVAELDGPTIAIGKAADCNLNIDDDPFISRHHARLTQEDGAWFLEDLTSSNGTFLRVKRRLALEAGDEFIIGNCTLRLEKA